MGFLDVRPVEEEAGDLWHGGNKDLNYLLGEIGSREHNITEGGRGSRGS